ncbi:hypothetical protein K1719_031932 [Acacia pycnantha]|nr:hypothetical protein K1719_031932 [Acacia pycnantha]
MNLKNKCMTERLVELVAALGFDGWLIDDLDFLKQIGVDPEKVAISRDSYNGVSLVLLDQGIYRELDEEFRKDFCQLWEALLLQDSEKTMCLVVDYNCKSQATDIDIHGSEYTLCGSYVLVTYGLYALHI